MGYMASAPERAGPGVAFTRDRVLEGDVALVLSSLVDYRREAAWADQARAQGTRVGFVGLAASKLPDLFVDHSDFIVYREPAEAIQRLAAGEPMPCIVHRR